MNHRNQYNNNGINNQIGQGTQDSRAAIAKKLAFTAETCAEQIDSSCGQVSSNDKSQAQNASKGCSQIQQGALAAAGERASEGMNMGQLGQLAQGAAQGLGALAGQGSGSGQQASGDTPSSISDPSPSGTSLGSSLATPSGVAFDTTTNPSAATTTDNPGATNYASPTASQSTGWDPTVASSLAGTDTGATSGSSPSFASSSPSGSGATGPTSSSGASMMGAVNKAGAAAPGNGENNEVSLAGGGIKPFLGLKSHPDDLADLANDPNNNPDSLGGLTSDQESADGGRELASVAGSDIHAEDGSSIFQAIHTKYSEMKKRGGI
jgi:hypothetical protein